MNEQSNDPYKTPEAVLVQPSDDSSILSFKRFSAWAVFVLSVITLGIYAYFWLFSRTKTINKVHENPISSALMICFLIGVLFSYASSFTGDSEVAVMAGLVITIAYLVLYIVVIFTMRNRLQDIMNRSSNKQYKLNRVLAFFFYSIYFQYKINECIDDLQSSAQQPSTVG